MSAIDNAFVRAYRRKSEPMRPAAAADQPPPAFASTSETTEAMAAVYEPAIVASESHAANQAATETQPLSVRILSQQSDSDSVVPAPHIRLAAFTEAATTLDIAPASRASRPTPPTNTTIRIDPPAVISRAPVEIEPTNEASSISLPISAQDAEAPSLQAAFEVDHFEWPAMCDSWTARLADDIDRLARELLAEAALDRRVIAISGCRRGEGRTTLALVLARRLAAGGAKVAIVDADLDSPDLAERLGLSIDGGWERIADDGKSVAAAMVESLEDRLTVLPLARPAVARLSETDQLAIRLRDCLTQMRSNFEIILIDAGPLVTETTICDQLFALGSPIDATILVADSRNTSREQLAKINRRLIDANIAPLGVAENYCSVYSSRSA